MELRAIATRQRVLHVSAKSGQDWLLTCEPQVLELELGSKNGAQWDGRRPSVLWVWWWEIISIIIHLILKHT